MSPGLAVLLALACSPGADSRPVADPIGDYAEPTRIESGEGIRIANTSAAERLHLYLPEDQRDLTLLFLGGRSSTPLARGGSAWADWDGGRLVVFDSKGLVRSVLSGGPPGGPPLTRPAFAAVDAGGRLVAVEIDGSALRFQGHAPEAWIATGLPGAAVGGSLGVLAATRTVFDIQLMPLRADDPLLWIAGPAGTRGIGRIDLPEQAMLAPVVNAGWVAPTSGGGVVFASAVRPELRRYGRTGALEWTSTWVHDGVFEPYFEASGGTLLPKFRLIQQAVAVGPDARIYVLATSGGEGPANRLLVFDADGALRRDASVGPAAAIYVGPGGHVYTLPLAAAMSRTEEGLARAPFPPFDVPSFDGTRRVRLEDYAGKVVVVNFWASWCAPCRNEMPLLDAYARELNPELAVVIGLNEDTDGRAADEFLRRLGGVAYLIGRGEGRLREQYGYRGLPYTVVLDGSGRLVRTIYGFGASIDPIREAVDQAMVSP
ncbi:MAG: redoxin domain-containing protein [Gemmatimonadales bacterium]